MQNEKLLSGEYRGRNYKIRVMCYRKTPSVQVELIPPHGGEAITITQNLGGRMPLYQCVLADGILGPDDGGFMDFMEANGLGYIADYKWYDRNVVTGQPRRLAAVFQFDARRLRVLDPAGCKQYEKHNDKLLRRLFEMKNLEKLAG